MIIDISKLQKILAEELDYLSAPYCNGVELCIGKISNVSISIKFEIDSDFSPSESTKCIYPTKQTQTKAG